MGFWDEEQRPSKILLFELYDDIVLNHFFVPEKVFQARQVSNLGSKSEDVYDHDFSASTPVATMTYLVNKREQATDKTNEALPSLCLWNIFED